MPQHKSHTEKHGDTKKTEKLELGGPHSELCQELKMFIDNLNVPCFRVAGEPSLCGDIQDIIKEHC